MVSIVAFQAVDPGSIPGHRTFLYFCLVSGVRFLPCYDFYELIHMFWKVFCLRKLTPFDGEIIGSHSLSVE